MNWSGKKVLVTGGNGFLGSHVVNELKNLNVKDIFTPASKDYDLRNRTDCKKVLKDIDVVFHLASTSGGIMFLKERPAEAFYDNIANSEMISWCWTHIRLEHARWKEKNACFFN